MNGKNKSGTSMVEHECTILEIKKVKEEENILCICLNTSSRLHNKNIHWIKKSKNKHDLEWSFTCSRQSEFEFESGFRFCCNIAFIQYPHYLMMHKLIIHHVCLCFSAAVRRNRLTSDATEKDIDSTVKRWLYLAPDRDGGRKERMKSKVHKDNMTG